MLALAAEQLLSGLAQQSINPLDIGKYVEWRYYATATLPGFWLLFSACYSRGNFRLTFTKRVPLIVAAFVLPIGVVFLANDGLAKLSKDQDQPFDWIVELGWSGFLVHLLLLVSMIASLVGLERTYRASVGTLRWKIKFMLYGMGTLFAARFFTSSQVILAQEIDPALETINAVAVIVCSVLVGRSVLRKGSFEIDLYPSRSIISGSLVITLAGTYLITVGVLAKVVSIFGGDQAFAIQTFLILVALVGLGLLLQSDRFRQLIRTFVSRNFQRPMYDYRTLWLKVTAATSQSVRGKDIAQSTTRLIANLFDTKLTNIWLYEQAASAFVLAASSDQQTQATLQTESKSIDSSDIQEKLVESPDPSEIEGSQESWVRKILEANPSQFDDGGNRVLVPLIGQGTVVGFIILGDRTNTIRFNQQDFDTLRCIGDHISASLLSAALTRKLEQSREIEAFQTMATFFVHDLKNAVSTLNLMLKNMPMHWDNPEFREDALRGLGSTSQRITDLITRLGQVRHELNIRQRPVSTSSLLKSVLEQWQQPATIEFSQTNDEDIQISGDDEKLRSVVLNLIINACEAIGDAPGKISLSCQKLGNFAVISVSDNGPGMSEDFMRSSLFRPFKTTKKTGLGIGMFQSKMVVEAHGGSIAVESKEGEGATFTLRFPVA